MKHLGRAAGSEVMAAVVLLRHVRNAVLALVALAGGCASDPAMESASAGDCVRSDEAVAATPLAPIRTFLEEGAPHELAARSFGSLIRPQQVATSPGAVFVADIGLRRILRVDPVRSTFVPLLFLEERPAGLAVDRMQTLYVAFPGSRRVVQVRADGQVTGVFQDPAGRYVPVDVAVSEAGRIFVADQINARVLVFNRLGQVVDSIGERGDRPNPFASVDALWFDGIDLYVLDATGRKVFLIGGGGRSRLIALDEPVGLPIAIAADRWQRVFIADRASGKVIVYDPASPAPSGPLVGMPAVQDLADIWIDDFDVLHVADAATASVLLYRIASPCQ
ncbi:MAG: NHL repeat-containing protein [Betaproteobacteria bacterium]|nr:MAG: NHL repeat-containing protein [Betaproteobacteria bacterium]